MEFDCNANTSHYSKTLIKDPKKTFEIEIPTNWKREFFIDNGESRLYCADTTKELTKTYILDLGYYEGNIELTDVFVEKIKNRILQSSDAKILKTSKFKSHNKEGIAILYNSSFLNFKSKTLQAYLKNNNESHYLLKIDTYGEEITDRRICEALSLFENALLIK